MNGNELQKYADMLVRVGANVQPGQELLLHVPVDIAPLARQVVAAAYRAGAKFVMVDWQDQAMKRVHLEEGPPEAAEVVDAGAIADMTKLLEGGGAVLALNAPKPGMMKGVDSQRVMAQAKANRGATKRLSELMQTGQVAWSIATVPTPEWARAVFPDLSQEEAEAKLWESIRYVTRLDKEDPVAYWQGHVAQLNEKIDWLTDKQFTRLIFKSETADLTLDLPPNHKWVGGALTGPQGQAFLPNLPTEEVFTAPLRTGVNGRVRATKPIFFNGEFVEGAEFVFRDGKVVEFKAKTGEEFLRKMMEMDEGACYLGEVALVPQDSPIANLGILFQNTLLDENASCHIALGSAYPLCVEKGAEMTPEQLMENGLNQSMLHTDFMIGSDDLNIDAETADGERVALFRNGNWAK
ncbi:MAG TPA: aminopeptidase [Bacilli bacterium]|nr:aminopeptidase [Bacilli bacterium]